MQGASCPPLRHLDLSHLSFPLYAMYTQILCGMIPHLPLLNSLSLHVQYANTPLCTLVELLAEAGTCSHFVLSCEEPSDDDEALCCQLFGMHTLMHVQLQYGLDVGDADDADEFTEASSTFFLVVVVSFSMHACNTEVSIKPTQPVTHSLFLDRTNNLSDHWL